MATQPRVSVTTVVSLLLVQIAIGTAHIVGSSILSGIRCSNHVVDDLRLRLAFWLSPNKPGRPSESGPRARCCLGTIVWWSRNGISLRSTPLAPLVHTKPKAYDHSKARWSLLATRTSTWTGPGARPQDATLGVSLLTYRTHGNAGFDARGSLGRFFRHRDIRAKATRLRLGRQ